MVSSKLKQIAILLVIIAANLVSCGSESPKHEMKPELQKAYAEGMNYMNQGRFFEAERKFSEILATDSTNTDVLYNRGLVYLSTRRPRLAEADFSAIMKLDSANADAYNSRGLARSDMEMYGDAVADYSKAIAYDGNFAEAYLNRAIAYLDMGQPDKCRADLDKAGALEPKNPAIIYQKGILNYKTSKYDESIVDFNLALSLGFSHPLLYQLLGNAYFRNNDLQKAILNYTESLKLEPTNTEVINNRAVAYDKLGVKDKAEQDRKLLEEIKKLSQPFEKIPYKNLKYRQYESSNKELAIELPEGWHMATAVKEHSTDMLISPSPVNTVDDLLPNAVRISLIKNMEKQMGTSKVDEILAEMNATIASNASSYQLYDLVMRKTINSGEYSGYYNLTSFKVTADDDAKSSFELLLAKPDVLCFGFLYSLSDNFEYLQPIYERAMKSLKIKY